MHNAGGLADPGTRTLAIPQRIGAAARTRDRAAVVTADPRRPVDEFELIERCFRDRATRRAGTVLGIGDDAALIDAGGRPLVRARATVAFCARDDGAAAARHAFAAAFIRLAAHGAAPRWATLALTVEAGARALVDPLAAAAAAICDACGVELIGGDTTRGPGRTTVFASGTVGARPGPSASPASAAVEEARIAFATRDTPPPVIADLVCVCAELAARGCVVRCDDEPSGAGARSLELVARTDAAGIDALRAVAGRLPTATGTRAPDG